MFFGAYLGLCGLAGGSRFLSGSDVARSWPNEKRDPRALAQEGPIPQPTQWREAARTNLPDCYLFVIRL